LERHGIEIARSTLCDWAAQCADLLRPLHDLITQRVLQSKVVHTDDTPVAVLDRDRTQTRTGRFWVYLGDQDHPFTLIATCQRLRLRPELRQEAQRPGRARLRQVLHRLRRQLRLRRPQHLCNDKGHDDPELRRSVVRRGYIAHITSRGQEEKERKKNPRYQARR